MGRKGNLAVFESSNISETEEVAPTKIGVHVCYMYQYVSIRINTYQYVTIRINTCINTSQYISIRINASINT